MYTRTHEAIAWKEGEIYLAIHNTSTSDSDNYTTTMTAMTAMTATLTLTSTMMNGTRHTRYGDISSRI